jgi:hypothetical protein
VRKEVITNFGSFHKVVDLYFEDTNGTLTIKENSGGILDKSFSHLTPLSGVAVQARHAVYIGWNRVHPM